MARLPVGVRCSKQLGIDSEHTSLVQGDEAVVHQAALARGVKITGATVHFVDEGMDSGPIILQKAVEVEKGDTPEVLQRRVMEQAEWKILPKAIDMIANGEI